LQQAQFQLQQAQFQKNQVEIGLKKLEPKLAEYQKRADYWAEVQVEHKRQMAAFEQEQKTLEATLAEKTKSLKMRRFTIDHPPVPAVNWAEDPLDKCKSAALTTLKALGKKRKGRNKTMTIIQKLNFESLNGPNCTVANLKSLWKEMDDGGYATNAHVLLPDEILNKAKTKLRCADGLCKLDLAFYILKAFNLRGEGNDKEE
jgi:hypothetical protein